MEDALVWLKIAKCFGAALAIGLGTLGPALSQGKIGATACENIGKYHESEKSIKGLAFLALIFVETSSVFSLLVVFLILALIN